MKRRRKTLTPTSCERLESRLPLAVSWSAGTWTIIGDGVRGQYADTIVIERSPANPQRLRAVVNGTVVGTRLETAVATVRVFGGWGSDTIRIDIPGNTRIKAFLDGGRGSDTVIGGEGHDTVIGGDGRDTLNGGRGDDTVVGGDGNDSLVGGAGDDALYGGAGADTLRGGAGRNALHGGLGFDRFYGSPGVDQVTLAVGEQLVGNESTNPLARMSSTEDLKAWYVDMALAQWGSQLGKPASPWGRYPVLLSNTQNDGRLAATTSSGPGDFSGTNNQVAGVDEGDMVKTDGRHLFVLSGDGVDIVAAWPAADIATRSHVTTPGWERALFLHGTRLTVISQENSWGEVAGAALVSDVRLAWWNRRWQPRVAVTVIDVTDTSAPTILETTRIDGWLVDSRAIAGRVLVVTQSAFDIPAPGIITIPPAEPKPDDGTEDAPPTIDSMDFASVVRPAISVWRPRPDDGTHYVYEDLAAYRERLDAAWAKSARPGYSVTVSGAGSSSGDLVAVGSTFLPMKPADNSLVAVTSFEVSDADAGPDAVTSVAGVSGKVYASTSSLYISAARMGNWWDVTDATSTTNIYKFDLQQDEVPLVAMGAVPGLTLNQFSLDENAAGLLRVATTNGFGDAASNGVFVLAAAAGNLRTIGSVSGLAKGERIFSVRFVGDVGYVSTFRQVDPLFVIDLATPTAPRVTGELKVPGFSNYLHLLDPTHLLGVGRDADPQTGQPLGLQLSIFDVGDPAQPTRTATYTFTGDGWQSWSSALWDHHAFSWFADQRILALPVQEGGWSAGPSQLVMFRVDVDAEPGFTRLGAIGHETSVMRSLRIGEFIYSVSAGAVQVHRIDDPSTAVGSVALSGQTAYPWFIG